MIFAHFTQFLETNIHCRFLSSHPVDFSLPWYKVFLPYKMYSFCAFFIFLLERVSEALLPFIISAIFIGQFDFVFLYVIAGFGILCSPLGFNLLVRTELQMIGDIEKSVHENILKLDPIHHTTRSSSLFIGKFKRGISAFSGLLYTACIDIPSRIIFLLVSIISLALINLWLGVFVLVMIAGIVTLNYMYTKNVYLSYKSVQLEKEDVYQENLHENISQALLIRASFATDERFSIVQKAYQPSLKAEIAKTYSFSFGFLSSKLILTISTLVIAGILYNLVVQNGLEPALAIATITSYAYGITQINALGSQILRLVNALQDIENFFKHMRDLGTSSYPSLSKNY